MPSCGGRIDLVEGTIRTAQEGTWRVRASHDLSGVTTTFDEGNLVPNAGLLPAAVWRSAWISLGWLTSGFIWPGTGRTAARKR
jgi:hypothetical protein